MPFERLRPLFRSLRFKLTVWNTVVVLLIAVLALVSVRQGLHFMLLHEVDIVLTDEAEEIALMLRQTWPDRSTILEELERKSTVHRQHGWFAQVLEQSGEVFWASESTPASLHEASPQAEGLPRIRTIGEYRMAQAHFMETGGAPLVVRVGTSTEFINQDVAQVTRIAAPVGLALLLLAPVGGFLLSGRATRPLRKIIAATQRLRPSRMKDRLPIRDTGDELDQLSEKVNEFLDRIAEYLAHHRDFVANAAHELRSPLTAIQSSVEIALGRERSAEEYAELLESIHEECAELTTLVNQLILLAESEAGYLEPAPQPVALERIVEQSLEMFDGVAEEKGIHVERRIESGVLVDGDPGQLRQVVNNLVDNAIRFTPPNGRVSVTLRHDHKGRARLTVEDTGSGIPFESLERIFERFYQVDPSRQRANGARGGGLGLSICRSIVTAHRGRIWAESEPNRGSKLCVWLPSAQGASNDDGVPAS